MTLTMKQLYCDVLIYGVEIIESYDNPNIFIIRAIDPWDNHFVSYNIIKGLNNNG